MFTTIVLIKIWEIGKKRSQFHKEPVFKDEGNHKLKQNKVVEIFLLMLYYILQIFFTKYAFTVQFSEGMNNSGESFSLKSY